MKGFNGTPFDDSSLTYKEAKARMRERVRQSALKKEVDRCPPGQCAGHDLFTCPRCIRGALRMRMWSEIGRDPSDDELDQAILSGRLE